MGSQYDDVIYGDSGDNIIWGNGGDDLVIKGRDSTALTFQDYTLGSDYALDAIHVGNTQYSAEQFLAEMGLTLPQIRIRVAFCFKTGLAAGLKGRI